MKPVSPFAKPTSIQVACIHSTQEFETLRSEWTRLLKKSLIQDAFLTWEWNYAWWQAYSEGNELWLLIARDAEGLKGIAPLVLVKKVKNGIHSRILCSLGDESLDVGGFIVPDGSLEIYAAFADFLKANQQHWDVLELNEFLLDDPGISTLIDTFRGRGLASYIKEKHHYFIPIHGIWQDYLGHLSSSMRSDLKSHHTRLIKQHKIDYIHHRGAQVASQDLASIYQINSQGKYAYLYRSKQEKVFQESLRTLMSAKGWMDVHLLFINGLPAAYYSGFYFEDRYEDWRKGFDPRFAEFSPGSILMMFLLEDAFQQGCHEFDFLRGDEKYKIRWKTSDRLYAQIQIVSPIKVIHWLIYLFLPKFKRFLKGISQRNTINK